MGNGDCFQVASLCLNQFWSKGLDFLCVNFILLWICSIWLVGWQVGLKWYIHVYNYKHIYKLKYVYIGDISGSAYQVCSMVFSFFLSSVYNFPSCQMPDFFKIA